MQQIEAEGDSQGPTESSLEAQLMSSEIMYLLFISLGSVIYLLMPMYFCNKVYR